MNKRLRLAVRNATCDLCKMHRQADSSDDVCVTGDGLTDAPIAIVTKNPYSPTSKARAEIVSYLQEAGLPTDQLLWLSAIKCKVWDLDPSKTDLKACRPYLQAELAFTRTPFVLSLGSEPLFATTGLSGIMKYRGKVEQVGDSKVFCTISPSMIARNPGLRGGFIADLMYFRRLFEGKDNTDEDPWHLPYDDQVHTARTKSDLRALVSALNSADAVAYDIETTGTTEFVSDARIVSLALTLYWEDGERAEVWRIPLYHPDSPFRRHWVQVLRWLAKALGRVPKRIGHNAKYDTRWLRRFGMPNLSPTFDTIIAAALLDENRAKGLKPLGQQLLGADPWGIDTSDLLNDDLEEILDYNGLDTWHTLRLYLLFRKQLQDQPRLGNLFARLMMPAVKELVSVEQRGVYVDRTRLADNWSTVKDQLVRINTQLEQWLPQELEIPATFRHKKTGEPLINFNPSNFLRWWLFDYLQLPVLARGKQKENGSPGDPSTAEAVMMTLAEGSDVAKLLLERVEWNKFDTAFFSPWDAQLDDNSRIHTTFKPWGTVTGRLSSGKEDGEKITGRKGRNALRGVNLQQVPRNKLARGVFGAQPGYTFVEADYSQIELRIAAFLAREPTMMHLYATGQDIHMAMAMRMTGKPASEVTPEERKKAKAVNFGFLYGMGWFKFVTTAWLNYGVRVSEDEAKAFRKSFFDQFPHLMRWHARQRRLAAQYKRVETPMGRVRHLPDIDSPIDQVRSEAERQAINSPVQGMASDMALLSLVHTSRSFRAHGIRGWAIGTVHDAVNFEILNEDVARAAPLIKHTMENLPLEELFGVILDVPIISDLKAGKHWGGASEIPAQLLEGSPDSNVMLAQWLTEKELVS